MKYTEKRIAIKVTEDQANKIEELKKEFYYNKSYSELYRDVIEAGLTASTKKGN